MIEHKDIIFDIDNLGNEIVVRIDRDGLLRFASILERKETRDFVLMNSGKQISIKTAEGINVLKLEFL